MPEFLRSHRRYLHGAAIAGIAASVILFFAADVPAHWASASDSPMLQSDDAKDLPISKPKSRPARAPELRGALASLLDKGEWLNGPAPQPENVRGKVVLVNFWTYSCINSLRPVPYLKAWADKYRERGLVVVGVHTPEFEFEKDLGNVRQALRPLGITYPIRLDSDYAQWRNFDNKAWPGFYIIDAKGRVVYQSAGERDYDKAERALQSLLREADGKPVNEPLVSVSGEGVLAAPNWADLRTPETYLGYARADNFVSPGGLRKDSSSQYQTPSVPEINHWGLSGNWKVGSEFAELGNKPGSIRYRFHARDLHLVLGSHAIGQPVSFRVTIDGAAPGRDRGADIDEQGWGTVREDRLYQLVRQKGRVVDRTFEIEFMAPGVRAYAFTFG